MPLTPATDSYHPPRTSSPPDRISLMFFTSALSEKRIRITAILDTMTRKSQRRTGGVECTRDGLLLNTRGPAIYSARIEHGWKQAGSSIALGQAVRIAMQAERKSGIRYLCSSDNQHQRKDQRECFHSILPRRPDGSFSAPIISKEYDRIIADKQPLCQP